MGLVSAPTPAVAALVRAGIAHRVHRYDHDPAVASYGQKVAEALGTEPARIFKTLVCSVDGDLVVALVPVTRQVDLKALAAALHAKAAAMAPPDAAQRATGYVVGGISPVGQKRLLTTLVDTSASEWDTVFVRGGRRGLELELTVPDLLQVTGGRLAGIARATAE